jgi:hypothetical protein
MAFFMALLMTLVITFINLGFTAHFFSQWLKAFTIAWPLSSIVAFVAVPLARKITIALVGVIEKR